MSSMWPCQASRQVEQLAHPRERQLLELRHRGRRPPEHAVGVHRRRQQLGEDARLRARDREVGEEARVIPVRDAGQQHAVEVGQHVRERLGLLGRRRGQLRADLARRDRRHHGPLAHALEIVGGPVDRGVAVGAELLRIRHAREASVPRVHENRVIGDALEERRRRYHRAGGVPAHHEPAAVRLHDHQRAEGRGTARAASTSSTSASATPTSRRPRSPSRSSPRRRDSPATTATRCRAASRSCARRSPRCTSAASGSSSTPRPRSRTRSARRRASGT